MSSRRQDSTEGRIYGGDSGLIHIADGERRGMGRQLAQSLDLMMREAALSSGTRTGQQVNDQNLCPGCYMVALFNAALELARQNGQDVRELGRSLSAAFERLAYGDDATDHAIEHINVILDPVQPDDDVLQNHLGISEQALIFAGLGVMGVPT